MTVKEWLGEGNQLGTDILDGKYQYDNETFDEFLDRVSGGDEDLRKLIIEKKFLPGGRTIANRNTGKKGSFSNCYSRGFVEDDLSDLMQANTDIALTFKAQGGQGISLSHIRPKGCGINNGQFNSDGIVPFMEIYNRTTESISQGGSRKGALIMSLDIWHKEAEEFITIKSQQGRIEKANLSLEIDDEFMQYVQHYYDTGEEKTKVIYRNYNGNKITYEVTPIKLYKLMMQNAYDWAEPGCIFVNRFRNYNIMEKHDEYKIETCNPCGEQPLPKHGACNLGSINLSEFVKNPFTPAAYFDYQEFSEAVAIAVKALDVILDENMDNHPLPEQREMAYNYRNVGLGIMGMHDCLIKMCIVYGSEESKKMLDEIMHRMFRMAVITSNKLAESKGAFPKYNDSVLESEILKLHFADWELENFKEYGLRNCSLLSIAPSGSIGTMLNISTGCEPHFQLSYKRKTESLNGGKEQYYDVYVGVAQEYINKFNATELPAYFNTSSDIDWKDRVEMQGILQNHVDTAISSTVNLPNEATVEEIEKLYLYAWQQGLKGLTMFRDGCKRVGILTTEKPKDASEELVESVDNEFDKVNRSKWPVPLGRGEVIKVNDNCIGKKRTLHTGCGTMHCTAFFDPVTGDLLETYLSKGSSGGCNSFMVGLSRMMSLAARGGISVEDIVDQLKSTLPCTSYAIRSATNRDTSKGSSCPMAIGNVLMDMYKEMQDDIKFGRNDVNFEQNDIIFDRETTSDIAISKKPDSTTGPKCPRCGGILVFEGGCNNCKDCGWSKCD